MVITFVVDNCLDPKNGTSMTAYRFIEGLRARGHEVRTLTIGDAAPDNYFVEEAQYGFISEIGHWHGFRFAKFDEKTVRRALEGSDIVHFLLPLPFEIRVYHLARKMGIPCSAAFHMQPENAFILIKYRSPVTQSISCFIKCSIRISGIFIAHPTLLHRR